MTREAGAEKRRGEKILWIILGVLLAVIVVLVIGIVVAKQLACQNLESQTPEEQSVQEDWEEEAEEGEMFAGTAGDSEGENPIEHGVAAEYSEIIIK